MTRDEQIIEASHNYGKTLNEEAAFDYEDMKCAFKNGAKWADEHPINVWRDVSEEPNIDEDVVLFDSCKNFVTEFYNGDITWHNIVLFHKATMWAYEDDLLPKGGKK